MIGRSRRSIASRSTMEAMVSTSYVVTFRRREQKALQRWGAARGAVARGAKQTRALGGGEVAALEVAVGADTDGLFAARPALGHRDRDLLDRRRALGQPVEHVGVGRVLRQAVDAGPEPVAIARKPRAQVEEERRRDDAAALEDVADLAGIRPAGDQDGRPLRRRIALEGLEER